MNSRIVEQFLELVQIDSETYHEENISPVLQTILKELGFDVYVCWSCFEAVKILKKHLTN